MYCPQHFEETDTDAIAGLIAACPLACVVAQAEGGLVANHLPLMQARSGLLIGHIARANDMHELLADGQEVLAVFRGDDAYVSPNYYPTKAAHHRHVPTWNYQVAHVHGTLRFHHDAAKKRAAVGLLTRTHERRVNGTDGWKMTDAPGDFMAGMLDAIVAFDITPTRIFGKSKLSQNREPVDLAGAVEGVAGQGHGDLARKMAARGRS